MANKTDTLGDILSVERELSRVRGEIEQMQGKLRLLGDIAALSTITLDVEEIRDYTPAPPTFAARVAHTWSNSLGSLSATGQTVAVILVGLAPWLGVVSIPGLGGWLLMRRSRNYRSVPPPLK